MLCVAYFLNLGRCVGY